MHIRPALLVFDLDGTLIDSRTDLTNSVNAMLAHFGKQELAEPTVASYIGDGAAALVRRALAHAHLIQNLQDPHDDAFVSSALAWFVHYYGQHKLDHTRPYPGVLDALKTIRSRHPALPMAVLTNKPVGPSRDICLHLHLEPFFFAIYGGNSFSSKKPEPAGLLHIIGQAGANPAATVMIGDSHVDVQTARACGARTLGCTFGLSPETLRAAQPDALVDRAGDWPVALQL